MKLYFVTHSRSAPSKWRNEWDFLAVTPCRNEAYRLVRTIKGATGFIQRTIPNKENVA
jgi:hypothetical protein